MKDLDDLKRHLIAEWSGLHQSIIDAAVDQWYIHLHCCVKMSGRHCEPLL